MKKNDGCQDLEGRENGEIQVKGYKILVVRINSEDLMYNTLALVNNVYCVLEIAENGSFNHSLMCIYIYTLVNSNKDYLTF